MSQVGRQRYDVVVVGGGSAGCVMAARLSEDSGRSVLLLEAGPDYGPEAEGRWPAELLDDRDMPLDSHSWRFVGRREQRARVLGGCSSHNACFVVWAPPGDHERWVQLGNSGWGFDEQTLHLQRAEAMIGADIPPIEQMSWFVEPFMEACQAIGYERLERLNGPAWTPGVALLPRNAANGVRRNAAFAYLDPIRHRPNLEIRGDTLVDSVVLDHDRAVGVTTQSGNSVSTIEADTVILAAGTYMTPAILHRSGIGPAAVLESIGVGVKIPLAGVGANLRDHPFTTVEMVMESPPARQSTRLPEVVLHARSGMAPDRHWDTQVLIDHEVSDDKNGAQALTFSLHAFESDSVGSVQAASADPNQLPILRQPWTSITDHDVRVLEDAGETVQRLCETGAFGARLRARTQRGRVDDRRAWIRQHAAGYWHPVGTCRMGLADDVDAVVDARGRVHGVADLRVVDASIFPTIPRANTNLPTMAAAEFIASTMVAGHE